jgi:hypothetical protein
MTNNELRILRLENALTGVNQQLADLFQQVGKIAQNQWATQGMGGGGGGGGGVFFCLPTALGGATGAWPSLTPASQSLAIYQAAGASLTSLGSFTVYNYFPAAPAASKVLLVLPDGSGNYVAVSQSCT